MMTTKNFVRSLYPIASLLSLLTLVMTSESCNTSSTKQSEKIETEITIARLLTKSIMNDINNEYIYPGCSILFGFCENGNKEAVEILLKYGADVESSKDGFSPFWIACLNGHLAIAKLLKEYGADINHADVNEELTPLHAACLSGHVSIVTFLLACRAKPDEKDYDEETPFMVAKKNGHKYIVDLLHRYLQLKRNNLNGPSESIEVTIEIAKLLSLADSNMPIYFYPECSPLFGACEKGDKEVVEGLLKDGADVESPQDEFTPLWIACLNGHLAIAALLKEKGADINKKGNILRHETPLYAACYAGHFNLVKTLLEWGANPHVLNLAGETPLMIAQQAGHQDIVDLLHNYHPTR